MYISGHLFVLVSGWSLYNSWCFQVSPICEDSSRWK